MNNYLTNIIKDVESNRTNINPVESGWISSCKKIGIPETDPFVQFGLLFAEHPDLSQETNAYHNNSHAADAVISASHLAVHEFTNNSQELKHNGAHLLFSMLSHDIAHTGGHNTYDYELEQKAVLSMQDYVKSRPEMMQLWKDKLESIYGSWEEFSTKVSDIILGTDFKNGPTKNLESYSLNSQSSVKINQLKLLANEADILPSCTHQLGPKLGAQLAEEQNNPGVGSWGGRLFFLKNLAKFGSNASQSIKIKEHINNQVTAIELVGVDNLNAISKEKGLEKSCAEVSSNIPVPVTNKFFNNFSNSLNNLRSSIENSVKDANNLKYKR